HVLTASNGVDALEQVQAQDPDLVVLDLLMPQIDGFQVLKELRSFSMVPVIILTCKDGDMDKIKGLQLGADDYLPKPFNPDELVARIDAVRRRLDPIRARKALQPMSLGGITIDFAKRTVTVKGQEKYLRRIEWLLLRQLALNTGRLMTYEELLTSVWGPEYGSGIERLRTWVGRLRRKLESDPSASKLIRTVSKTGYIIDSPTSEQH
nr:response regulator [Gammaproteobacteria bacterium]